MQSKLTAWESGGEPLDHRHLAQVWAESVALFGPQIAILGEGGPITYDQLDARVAHLAARLEDQGVTRGTVVACLLTQRLHLAEVLLAISRLGAVYLPIDADLPDQRRRTILDDAYPALILSEAQETVEAYGLPVLVVDGAIGRAPTAPIPDHPRDPLAILYTSGSTGVPKGVIMVHGGIINECRCAVDLVKLGIGDRLLQFASPGFDTCLEELISPLICGATLVPRPERIKTDLIEFQHFVESSQITVLDLPTAHWTAWSAWMANEGVSVPSRVKATIIGGERATAAALADWFRATTAEQLLVNTYGPTEASIAATGEFIRHDWSETGDPAIGRPFPGLMARVADDLGRPLPPGAAGELWLGGIAIGPGYWQRPERTEAAFRDLEGTSWYRTGDRVSWDSDGKLHFLGRKDDQLKIRGNRVEPREVTRVLETYPGVTTAHAGPVKRPDGSVALGAWIRWETAPDSAWPSQVAAFAAQHLPAAAVPSRWCAVENFILNERGKLDRHRLPEPNLTASTRNATELPVTPTENFLASIWSDLLNVSVVGRDESFFELGGDSMAALRLFARIHTERKLRVPMATLIQAPSLRQLGEAIDQFAPPEESTSAGDPLIVAVRTEGRATPLFCVHGGDGGAIFYRQLANHLPPGRPVFAIESPYLGTSEPVPSVSIEETAVRYVRAMRRIQPSGPYQLLGYCYGGLLVYEMTRILMAAGETVTFTGLVDAINPRIPLAEYSLMDRARISWRASESAPVPRRLAHLAQRLYSAVTDRARVEWQTWQARRAKHSAPYSQIRATQVRTAHLRSEDGFQPNA
jgi:amino acid adenylation domain-containing protein